MVLLGLGQVEVGERTRTINDFVEHDNAQALPFAWVATAEPILAKIQRLCKAISRTRHQGQDFITSGHPHGSQDLSFTS